MVTPPELSVVLLARNRERLVATQLEALAAQQATTPWELIVVDNASTDATLAVVGSFHGRIPGLTVVALDRPAKIGQSLNAGARAAQGSKLAFLNDDDEVAPGWVDAIAAALETSDAAGGRLAYERLNEDWIVAVRGRPQSDELWRWYRGGEFPVVFGCALAVRRTVFDDLGGFDEELGLYEDADFSLRLHDHGYRISFAADAVVHYRLRGSLRSLFSQARFYGEGLPAFYAKHRGRLPRPPLRAGLQGWASVFVALARVRDRVTAGRFLWQLGWRIGLARGSARSRYLLSSE